MPYHGAYFEKSSIQLGGVNSDGNPVAEMHVSRNPDGSLIKVGLDLVNSDVEYMLMDSESISFYNKTDKTGDLAYQAELGARDGLQLIVSGWNYNRSAFIGPHDAIFDMPVIFNGGVSGIADIRSGTYVGDGVSGRLIDLGINAKMVIVKRVGQRTWYFVGEYLSSGSTLRISSGSNSIADENVYLTGTYLRLGPGSLAGMNEDGATYYYYAFG